MIINIRNQFKKNRSYTFMNSCSVVMSSCNIVIRLYNLTYLSMLCLGRCDKKELNSYFNKVKTTWRSEYLTNTHNHTQKAKIV